MTDQQFEGADRVPELLRRNTSPRYKRLEALERWVDGTQYQDRTCDWFDDAVPLWERRPCIVYPATSLAIESYVDLMLGESRFPDFTTRPGEDEADDAAGLDEASSQTVDRFVRAHHDACSFKAHARDALRAAMGCGTAVGLHGHRDGKPFAELVPAKWATPVLDVGRRVTALEIRYPYIDEYQKPDGRWAVRVRLYRRVIDAKSDVAFLPAEATEDGREPSWTADVKASVDHNLGFCPVVWYPFMRGCQPVNVIDGKAIHALTTDEIQQHDIARSQWHRCALFSEPQMVEIGVTPGFNPTGDGRPAVVPSTELGGQPTALNRPTGGYQLGSPAGGARKKGPGYVNQYPDEKTKVELLTTPAEALEAQRDNVSDLRLKVQEALCVVFLDPENIKFAATTSGKALETLKQRQIDRCGQYRDDFTDHFLRPTLDMQLRIASTVGANLKLPLLTEAMRALEKFSKPAAPGSAA